MRAVASVVEVEVLRRLLLEPEIVVLGGVLEEVGRVLEHVLVPAGRAGGLGLLRRLLAAVLVVLVSLGVVDRGRFLAGRLGLVLIGGGERGVLVGRRGRLVLVGGGDLVLVRAESLVLVRERGALMLVGGGSQRLFVARRRHVGREHLLLVLDRGFERVVELVGEALFAEEVVVLPLLVGERRAGHLGVGAGGLDPTRRVDGGEAGLGELGVDQLLVGRAPLLGAGAEVGLDVEEFSRLLGDRVALLGRGAAVDLCGGRGLVLGGSVLLRRSPGLRLGARLSDL